MTEAQARSEYDQMASSYDHLWHIYLTRTLTFLQAWANIQAHELVLDIACGTGVFEQRLLMHTPRQRMLGIDIAPRMLQIAAQKCRAYRTVAFQQASASALPFASDTFDVLVSASSFHYFDTPHTALAEMKRVLKPHGRIVILDWCKDFLVCRLCDMVLHVLDPAHTQCYTQAELHALLVHNNLHVHCAHQVRFGPVWGLMVVTATQ